MPFLGFPLTWAILDNWLILYFLIKIPMRNRLDCLTLVWAKFPLQPFISCWPDCGHLAALFKTLNLLVIQVWPGRDGITWDRAGWHRADPSAGKWVFISSSNTNCAWMRCQSPFRGTWGFIRPQRAPDLCSHFPLKKSSHSRHHFWHNTYTSLPTSYRWGQTQLK